MTQRRHHGGSFKARVAVEAMAGRKTVNEIASAYEIHPSQVGKWKAEALARLPEVGVRRILAAVGKQERSAAAPGVVLERGSFSTFPWGERYPVGVCVGWELPCVLGALCVKTVTLRRPVGMAHPPLSR